MDLVEEWTTSLPRLPAVLSRDEVRAVLVALEGPMHLIALLLYGAGLRVFERLTLRAAGGGRARAPHARCA